MVWGISHFHSYLYGGDVTVITDHSAVKQVLQSPNPTGKHARWWTDVYGRGIKSVNIVYRAGRENASADALSRSPVSRPPSNGPGQDEVQVYPVTTTMQQTPMDTIPEDLPSPLSRDHLQNAESADCMTISAQSMNEATTCASAASRKRTDISPDQPQSNNPSTDSGHQCTTDEKGRTRIGYSLRRKCRPPDRF